LVSPTIFTYPPEDTGRYSNSIANPAFYTVWINMGAYTGIKNAFAYTGVNNDKLRKLIIMGTLIRRI
jgi:hypothetical protein